MPINPDTRKLQEENIRNLEKRGDIEGANKIREFINIQDTKGTSKAHREFANILRRPQGGGTTIPTDVQNNLPQMTQDQLSPDSQDLNTTTNTNGIQMLGGQVFSPQTGGNTNTPSTNFTTTQTTPISPLQPNVTTFSPNIASDYSKFVDKYKVDQYFPDLNDDAVKNILSTAQAQGIDLSDSKNLANLKLQHALQSIDEQGTLASKLAAKNAAYASYSKDIEMASIERQRKNAMTGEAITEDEARSLAKYMFDRTENLMSDNATDLQIAKTEEMARARRLLGNAIDDSAGVKIITDLGAKYDTEISRVRRDKTAELQRMATSHSNLERGFALARSQIESSAIDAASNVNLNFFDKMMAIDEAFDTNTMQNRQLKRQAIEDRVSGLATALDDKQKTEREMMMWNLNFQQKQQELMGSFKIVDINGESMRYNEKTGQIKPVSEWNSTVSTADFNTMDKINLFGMDGTITSLEPTGDSPWGPGLDVQFSGMQNAQIPSPIDGTVFKIGNDPKGFGNYVMVKDNNTGEVLRISHLSSVAGLKAGQSIPKGTVVGNQGNTGNSIGKSGVHVDFTIYKDDSNFGKANTISAREVLAKFLGRGGTTYPKTVTDTVDTIMQGGLDMEKAIATLKSPAQQRQAMQLLQERRQQLSGSGDPTGVMMSSAGGKPLSDSTIQSLNKAVAVVDQVENLNAILNTKSIKDSSGAIFDISPISGWLKEKNPWNKDAAQVGALLKGTVPNLARGIYGEVGVLTDADVRLYQQTLPNLRQTDDVRKLVTSATLRSIKNSITNILVNNANNGSDVSRFVSLYNNIDSKISQIDSELMGKAKANNPSFSAPSSGGDDPISFLDNHMSSNGLLVNEFDLIYSGGQVPQGTGTRGVSGGWENQQPAPAPTPAKKTGLWGRLKNTFGF